MTTDQVVHFFEMHYDTKPEYLWDKFPNYAVFRHEKNEKWYALVMDVPAEKFDLKDDEKTLVLNLKTPPEFNGGLRTRRDF